MCAGAATGTSRLHISRTLTLAHQTRVTIYYRMTVENIMSQMGLGTKQITDRYAGEYGAPVHEQQVYFAYEPSPPAHQTASSKHHHGGSGLKSNASMSALTLLAFLFFLHILQQCIKEHMTEMSSPPVVVMTAGREGEKDLSKSSSKIDKIGEKLSLATETAVKTQSYDIENENIYETEKSMMRINAAEHKPKIEKNDYVYKHFADRDSFPGFVRAIDEK